MSNVIDVKLEKYRKQSMLPNSLCLGADVHIDDTLLLQGRIARLDRPSGAAVVACRTMMLGPDGKDAKLGDGAERMFAEKFKNDLVALAPSAVNNPLSQFLKEDWLFCRSAAKFSR